MALGIRAKLLLTFGALALVTAIVGGFSVYGLQQLNENGTTLYSDVLVGSHLLTRYVRQASIGQRAALAYPLAGTPAERQAIRGQVVAADKALVDLVRQMDEADTDREDVESLALLQSSWKAYATWRDKAILSAVDNGQVDEATAAYRSEGVKLEDGVNAATDHYLTIKSQTGLEISDDGRATYAWSSRAGSRGRSGPFRRPSNR